MTIRKLLVPLSGDEAGRAALSAALRVATAFGAHVEALHVRPDPQDAVPLLGEGVSGAMIEDLIRVTGDEAASRAAAAQAAFSETCAAHDVPVAETPPQPGASAAFHDVVGREEDETVRRARLADLVVMPRAAQDTEPAPRLTLNAALFESGRAVLVVPPEPEGATLPARRIGIAWNGSAQAARAVAAALPFLDAAEAVTVFSAATSATAADAAGELATYLHWHGIAAQVGSVSESSGPVGTALLDSCRAEAIDVLVIGAYTHSRLRELIIGGVTRLMLEDAPIPLLMSH